MPIIHDVIQYSEAYEALRRGLPTASNFKKIITPEGRPSKSWEEYAFHLISERVLQRGINTYTSPHMENGLLMEPDAVAWYEYENDLSTTLVGFVTTDDGKVGCSPDRLVGDKGLLQVKCPQPQTQMRYLLTGKLEKEYMPQLQGELYVTGREWVDIVAWHAELPRLTIRVERDAGFIASLEKLLTDFNHYIDEVMKKISSMEQLNHGDQNGYPKIFV